MIARSIYEILPTSYLLVGGSTIVLHQESIAVVLAFLVFVLGARIYNLRSKTAAPIPEKGVNMDYYQKPSMIKSPLSIC